MITETLKLPGCLRLTPKILPDRRGVFVKPFVSTEYRHLNLPTVFEEEYYSRSSKNVLRGMHYQTPPHDYFKLVSCLHGQIRDVIVDLRVGSPQFKRCQVLELNAEEETVLCLPPGVAHGFLVLSAMAIVAYKVTSAYMPENDTGVRWDSIGVDWGVKTPRVSPRDAAFPGLADLESPFVYQPEEIQS